MPLDRLDCLVVESHQQRVRSTDEEEPFVEEDDEIDGVEVEVQVAVARPVADFAQKEIALQKSFFFFFPLYGV